MNTYDFKKEVESRLLELRYSHRINKNQIALRCQFCGDSKKNPNKTRFYVQINADNDNLPMLYNCFNCGVSGIITPSVLRTFEINDLQLSSALTTFNKTTTKRLYKSIGGAESKFNFSVPYDIHQTRIVDKYKYLNSRLGMKIPLKEWLDLKVVFSLQSFLNHNKIDSIATNKNTAQMLDNDYVGFLSVKNESIVFRDITGKNKARYFKYSIYPNIENTKKFYVIPNSIDVVTSEPVYINMAEGVFDILGVYYHINNKNLFNQIYVAICDSSYAGVIKYFLGLGLIGENVIINIFSDADHDTYFYSRIISELSPWVNKINLFYNSKSKDYGVPKDEIELYKAF